VVVDSEAFPAIIGKNGATITKLREEYGVDLIRLKVREEEEVVVKEEEVEEEEGGGCGCECIVPLVWHF